MKKKFRIIAAALALCLSVLCSPAALAGGYGTAAATQPAAAVQTISDDGHILLCAPLGRCALHELLQLYHRCCLPGSVPADSRSVRNDGSGRGQSVHLHGSRCAEQCNQPLLFRRFPDSGFLWQ